MNHKSFVVTLSAQGASKAVIWKGDRPLPIGIPVRHVLERTSEGARLRDLNLGRGGPVPGSAKSVTHEMMRAGAPITLGDFSIALRERRHIPSATSEPAANSGELCVHVCRGSFISDLTRIGDKFEGRADQGVVAFAIYRVGGLQYRIDVFDSDVVVRGAVPGSMIRADELARVRVLCGRRKWVFTRTQLEPLPEPTRDLVIDSDEVIFRKALKTCSISVGLLCAAAMLIPFPQSEELVPAQYASIVMSQKTKSASQAASAQVGGAGKPQPHRAAVAEAFRAETLRKSMSGLLRGGMNKLLEHSDTMAGVDPGQTRRIFNTPSEVIQATSPGSGARTMGAAHVSVSGLGGGAGSGGGGQGTGTGVGYGKGTHAAVTGQGSSLVSMDSGGASVDDGLSRDEVGEVIHRHLNEVRYCYEAAMLRTPDVEGKLTLNFTINPPGSVVRAIVKASTLSDSGLDECVLRKLLTWRFPNPKGGIEVAVNYPFIFKTIGR